jgi:hypothetical protein
MMTGWWLVQSSGKREEPRLIPVVAWLPPDDEDSVRCIVQMDHGMWRMPADPAVFTWPIPERAENTEAPSMTSRKRSWWFCWGLLGPDRTTELGRLRYAEDAAVIKKWGVERSREMDRYHKAQRTVA